MRLLISIVAITTLLACHPSNSTESNTTDLGHTDGQNVTPPVGCGDGLCDGTENTINCAKDCESWCGDDTCNGAETTALCPQDCDAQGPSDICGDGSCTDGETTANCSQDCGAPPPASVCGDGDCNGGENATNCPQDCAQNFPPATGSVNANVHGFVDSVSANEGGATVKGWSCHLEQEAPIEVHVYAGGDVNSGTFLKATLANTSNEQAVNDACQASGSHRYHLSLSTEQVSAHAGKVIHAYGVSMQGSAPLANSGEFHLPGGAPPINNDVTGPPAADNPPPIAADLSNVVWIHEDISGWPETVTLNASKGPGDTINIQNNGTTCGPGNVCWPTFNPTYVLPGGNHYNKFVGGVWIFVYQDDVWVAGLFDSILRNQQIVWDHNFHTKNDNWPAEPLKYFEPQSGERYGWMISTAVSALSTQYTINERSNVSEFVWP